MMKKGSIAFFVILANLLCACNSQTTKSSSGYHAPAFSNPLITDSCADPSVLRANDGYFYIYSTQSTVNDVTYVAPCWRSKDMINVEFMGSIFDSKPSWSRVSNSAVWAPHVIYRNNLYYYYYTLGVFNGDIKASGVGVATSSTPYGPFVDHGKLFDGYDVDYGSPIDQCVFEYEDKLYLAFGTFAGQSAPPNQAGIYYFELSSDGLSVQNMDKGKKLLLNDWSIEGPYIVNMKGKWYLFGSGGTCCRGVESSYYVKVYQADSPFGPYKDSSETYEATFDKKLWDYNGEVVIQSLTSRFEGSPIGNVAGPGHNAIFQDDRGDYFIFYHGWDRFDKYDARVAFYDRLNFDPQGFPYVTDKVSSYGDIVRGPTIYPEGH